MLCLKIGNQYFFPFNDRPVPENLQYLRLGDNNIHTIPTEALKRLHRLRHLDLRSNNISYIAEDAFIGFGDSITFLNLQKNL
jgi:Leucine-rich repeat (LRR) protein